MISAAVAPSASALRDVLAAAGRVHVRRRRVHGEQDQLLHLRLERALTPRDARELRVRREEVGVELEQPVERTRSSTRGSRGTPPAGAAVVRREPSVSGGRRRGRRALRRAAGSGRAREGRGPATMRVAPFACELAKQLVAGVGLGDVHEDRAGPVALHLLVVVDRVRGEHDGPAGRVDKEDRWPGECPPTSRASTPGASSRRRAAAAPSRPRSASGRSRYRPARHAPRTGGACPSGCPRTRAPAPGRGSRASGKAVEVAGVVPVQVRQHQAGDGVRRESRAAPWREGSMWARPPALRGRGRVPARVDEDRLVRPANTQKK